ncbi:MAG: LysE family translocator [Rhizobiaceae bacterium]|nr:LysE family translocator [Rhizobiaceae bacterium]
MDYAAIGPYFVALLALTAAPGPIMAVLVARSLGRDTSGAMAFAAGLCAGDVIAVCAVALGVGVWATGKPEWLSVAKYVGVAYLLWLSVKMWNDRAGPAFAERRQDSRLASVGAGMALCLGNPSTVLIYVLLLPSIAPTGITSLEHLALIVLLTFAAVGAVFFGTILAARQISRIIASPGSSGALSRVTAGVIALTSVWILAA